MVPRVSFEHLSRTRSDGPPAAAPREKGPCGIPAARMPQGHVVSHLHRVRLQCRDQHAALVTEFERRLGGLCRLICRITTCISRPIFEVFPSLGAPRSSSHRRSRDQPAYRKAPPRSGVMLSLAGYPRGAFTQAIRDCLTLKQDSHFRMSCPVPAAARKCGSRR